MHSLTQRSTAIAMVMSLLAACGGSGSNAATTTSSSLPATDTTATDTATTDITTTTIRTTTSISTTTTMTTEPDEVPVELDESELPAIAADAPCLPEWAPLTAADEITFVRAGDVFTFAPSTGELRCLATIDREPRRLDWNPAGDHLLIDSDLMLTESGVHPSGFAVGTPGISWSQPMGTAVIAPSDDGTELLHINADRPDDVLDVASLAVTWAAAYHPSGLAIVSAGISDEGVAGIFIADNRGADPRPLVVLDDQATSITEIVFGHSGDWIAFVHDHTESTTEESGSHVHRLFLPSLALYDLAESATVPTGLITSEESDGQTAWTIQYSTVNTQTSVMTEDAVILNRRLPETVSTPVGFLDDGTAAMVARPVGPPVDHDGGDLWLYPTTGGSQLVARGVSAATTRTVHDPNWSEPPLEIDQRAVG